MNIVLCSNDKSIEYLIENKVFNINQRYKVEKYRRTLIYVPAMNHLRCSGACQIKGYPKYLQLP